MGIGLKDCRQWQAAFFQTLHSSLARWFHNGSRSYIHQSGKFSSLTLPLKYWACRCSTCLDVGRSDGSEGLTKESNFFSLWSKYGNSVSVWIILWPRYFTSPNTYPYPSSDTLHDNENQCLNWNQHKKILSDSSDTLHTIMIKTCHRFSPCMLWLLVKVFWTIGLMYLRHF